MEDVHYVQTGLTLDNNDIIYEQVENKSLHLLVY